MLYDTSMIAFEIRSLIEKTLKDLGLPEVDFVVEHPLELSHGDYSTNIALVLCKKIGEQPKDVAEKIINSLSLIPSPFVKKIEIAGPGFINFFLGDDFFVKSLDEIISHGDLFGTNDSLQGKKTIVEYTDPNPIKEFHIGHLMSNAIGESIASIIAFNGAEVKRACYQGDVGLHVGKAVAYKIVHNAPWTTVAEVADAYTRGSKQYEEDVEFQKKTIEINKLIYNKEDETVNEIYQKGRQLALDYFETIYKKLGTKFDFYFFESTSAEFGKALVRKHLDIFEESEGAIVFRGEKHDPSLHTRVFINKEGLPTYEAKELGLAKIKHDVYPYDRSIVITGNEINDYFRVLLSAMTLIFPDLAEKTRHVSHGMLRLPSGKMSSRTGDVITASWLIGETQKKIIEKISKTDRDIEDIEKLSLDVAVAAIKYSILRQSPGKDIVFDFETSISFEGDSGPYLQYTYARTQSVLDKAKEKGLEPRAVKEALDDQLSRKLYRFPEIVMRSGEELASHYIVTYLTEMAGLFNRFYAETQIIDEKNADLSQGRIALARSVGIILKNGLNLLGIKAPKRM